MEKEIWKSVPSLDGLLQVSNLGNVREYVEAIVNRKKIIYKNRQIGVFFNVKKKAKITYKNKNYLVARLVAETFIKGFNQDKYITYKEGYSPNLNNLIHVDRWEVSKNGERNYLAKLKDDDIIDICKKILNGESCVSVAKEYGINNVNVSRILRKEIWKHIDRPYISLRELNYNRKNKELIKFLGSPIKYKQRKSKKNEKMGN